MISTYSVCQIKYRADRSACSLPEMVSRKKQTKEGVFLLRKTVRKGNEVRHIISAGAGVTLLHPLTCLDVPSTTITIVKQDAAPANVAASIVAAERHIQKFSESRGKKHPCSSDKSRTASSTINVPLRTDEFLIGTPILYKAVLALRSRYGNYLTFSESVIDASTQSHGPSSQFVIMNAENLADDGNMKYGNAVWLVVGNRRVLGSQHTGVGASRELTPALIKCTKSHLNRAHHTGKWIIMNRDDPLGMMGRSCNHGDRILLEQEWLFLSSSLDAVMLYKTKNNIANISEKRGISSSTAIDYFDPIEDCAWRVELVEQKDMGATDGRKRAELISRANSQLSLSTRARWKLKKDSFGQLSDKVDQKEEYLKISRSIKHKLSEEVEHEYLLKLYRDISSQKFIKPLISKPTFRSRDIGVVRDMYDTRPVTDSTFQSTFDLLEPDDVEGEGFVLRDPSPLRGKHRKREKIPSRGGGSPSLNSTILNTMNNSYWKVAQKLLVSTHAWSVLDAAMKVYYEGPSRQLKTKSAIIIQKFLRSHCKFLRMIGPLMNLVDCRTLLSLRRKREWRSSFIIALDAKRAAEQRVRSEALMYSYVEEDGDNGQLQCSPDGSCVHDRAEKDVGGSKHLSSEGGSGGSRSGSGSVSFRLSTNSSGTSGLTPLKSTSSQSNSLHAATSITGTSSRTLIYVEERDGRERERDIQGKEREKEGEGGNEYDSTSQPHHEYTPKDDISLEGAATLEVQSAVGPTHSGYSRSRVRPKTAPLLNDRKSGRVEDSDTYGSQTKRAERTNSTHPKEGLNVMEGSHSRRSQRADRLKRMQARETNEKTLIDKLRFSEGNPYGLPCDIFEHMQSKVSVETGCRFLSTVSHKFSAYV